MATLLPKHNQMDWEGIGLKVKDLDVSGTITNENGVLTPAAGITSDAAIYGSSVVQQGDLIVTRILIDLTDLIGSTTDLDIIGKDGVASHIGQITTAVNGVIKAGRMTCLELPAGGVTDIDLYSATVATGAEDVDVTTLTETAIVTAGGVWTNGAVKGFTTVPPANDYLYLTNGAAGVPGTFTAGKFLIELYGQAA